MPAIKRQWISPKWESKLQDADLLDFEALMTRDFDWFEPPNERRGGWSGVTRLVLNPDADAAEQDVIYLKIQKNHCYRAAENFFQKKLTFVREFNAMQAFSAFTEAVPEIALFAEWRSGKDKWAVLITKSLDHWFQYNHWLTGRTTAPIPDNTTILRALDAIAGTSREIHQAGWVHMCYAPDHLFIKPQADGSFQVRVIDFEKSRKSKNKDFCAQKDSSRILRQAPNMTDAQKIHYFKAYFQTDTLTPEHIAFIRKIRGAPAL